MGIKKVINWFVDDQDEDFDESGEDYKEHTTSQFEPRGNNTSNILAQIGDNDLITIRPRKYQDAADIVTHLKEGRAVIINLNEAQEKLATLIINFVNGAVFSLEGELQNIAPQIFVCTPRLMGIANLFPEPDNDDSNYR